MTVQVEWVVPVVQVVDDELYNVLLVDGRDELRIRERGRSVCGLVPEVREQAGCALQWLPGLRRVPVSS